ncbi:MAG: hypothetical protein RSE41_00310 [Clostridia bacterium]
MNQTCNAEAMTLQAELMQRGYMMDVDSLNYVSSTSVSYIKKLYIDIIPFIDEMMGNGEYHQMLYPGFPNQVMNLSEAERWYNQICHYLSNGTFIPVNTISNRGVAFEKVNYKILSLGNYTNLYSLYSKLCSTTVALSDLDNKCFNVLLSFLSKEELKQHTPNIVPFKEMACKLIDLGFYVPKTTTDVLRYAVYLSDGDISLPAVPPKMIKENSWDNRKVENEERKNFRFKKFSNPERHKILSLLENSNIDVKEMKLYVNRWIRIGEIIHPSKHTKRYPRTAEAFNKLRNDKVISWYGEVERAKDIKSKAIKLSERPGEFARKLDYLIRNSNNNLDLVLNIFNNISDKISNKVLFELYNHFLKRNTEYVRTVCIKGATKPTKLESLTPLSTYVVNAVKESIMRAIVKNFGNKESLENKVFELPDSLKYMPIPLNMRSVSSSLTQRIRGQRIPMDCTNKTLRFYVHWTDECGIEDLDLSAVFFTDNNNLYSTMSYNQLLSSEYAVHSGDVRCREGKCAEYIDIDIEKAINAGIKKSIIIVNNFTGKDFTTLDCFCGWMSRNKPECNNIWLPSTVENSFVLNNKSSNSIAAILDFETKEIIYVDMNFDSVPFVSGNVNKYDYFIDMMYNPTLSAYDIIKMNIEARKGKIYDEDNYKSLLDEESLNRLKSKVLTVKCDNYKEILDWML